MCWVTSWTGVGGHKRSREGDRVWSGISRRVGNNITSTRPTKDRRERITLTELIVNRNDELKQPTLKTKVLYIHMSGSISIVCRCLTFGEPFLFFLITEYYNIRDFPSPNTYVRPHV